MQNFESAEQIEEQLDSKSQPFVQDGHHDMVSNNSQNVISNNALSNNDVIDEACDDIIHEEFKLPSEKNCLTPNINKSIQITVEDDAESQTDVSSKSSETKSPLNKDLPDRPLSARANRLIKKIEFMNNYGGKTPERQEEKSEKDDQSIDEDDHSPTEES